MLNGPSHDLVGHRFGVRNQFCHFDERYHALRCTVDIVRMQPVMIVPRCAVRKKESLLIESVSRKKRPFPSLNIQVFTQTLSETSTKPV